MVAGCARLELSPPGSSRERSEESEHFRVLPSACGNTHTDKRDADHPELEFDHADQQCVIRLQLSRIRRSKVVLVCFVSRVEFWRDEDFGALSRDSHQDWKSCS